MNIKKIIGYIILLLIVPVICLVVNITVYPTPHVSNTFAFFVMGFGFDIFAFLVMCFLNFMLYLLFSE